MDDIEIKLNSAIDQVNVLKNINLNIELQAIKGKGNEFQLEIIKDSNSDLNTDFKQDIEDGDNACYRLRAVFTTNAKKRNVK